MATYLATARPETTHPPDLSVDREKALRLWADLAAAKIVVIRIHNFADPDAICSAFALGEYLEQQGKQVHYLCSMLPENFAARFSYIAGIDRIKTELPSKVAAAFRRASPFDPAYLVMALDTANAQLLHKVGGKRGPRVGGKLGPRVRLDRRSRTLAKVVGLLPKWVIDHHADNSLDATDPANRWIDGTACGVTEMLVELFLEWKVEFTPERSRLLLLGLLSDSAMMTSPGVTDRTLDTLAFLMERVGTGEFAMAAHAISAVPSVTSLHVIGSALQRRAVGAGGRTRFAVIPKQMLETLGATTEHARAAVNYLARGIPVAAVFIEMAHAIYHASLRSDGTHNVRNMVASVDPEAGGHEYAAGLTGPFGPCLRVVETVLSCVRSGQPGVASTLIPEQVAADAELARLMRRTNGFTGSNTRPRHLRHAARLIRAGASPARVAHQHRGLSEPMLDILAVAFQSAKSSPHGMVVSAHVRQSSRETPSAIPPGVREQVTEELMVRGASFAVLFDGPESGAAQTATIRAAPGATLAAVVGVLEERLGAPVTKESPDVLTVSLTGRLTEERIMRLVQQVAAVQRRGLSIARMDSMERASKLREVAVA